MGPTCETCRFWDDQGDSGMCRRHAPRMILCQVAPPEGIEPHQAEDAVWPWTEPDDWCGDHEPTGVVP